jgi:hypothetical protein
MAQVANTYETYDAVGNREELADKIYQITPEETPFLSLIGRKPVASVHPEWQTDTLGAVDTANNQPEGNDWTLMRSVPTSRVGNYTQISDKKIIISRTQDKTSKAGRKSELAREVAKKGVELRIDMEAITLATRLRRLARATARPTASSAPSARGLRPTTALAAAAARRVASTPRPTSLTRRPTAPSAPSPRRFWMRRSCPPTTRAACRGR